MPDLSPTDSHSSEAEIHALRAEIARLRTEQGQYAVQQKEAERFQKSQARFRTVFEHSPLGLKIIDSDLTVCQANAAVGTLLGFASSELLGRGILDFAHPDYYADWARLQQDLWSHRTPWFAMDTCLVRPDGSVLWCRVTSVLFPDEGGELGYTTLEDISVRKRLEAQVEQYTIELQDANEELAAFNEELQVVNEDLQEVNAQLVQTNTELDTFVYAASHDLRLPVTNLQGLVQALVEQLPADARQAELVEPILNMMHDSMDRFRHTLDRLADFGTARQETGQSRESVALAAVLDDVRQELAPLLAASGGQLDVDLTGNSTLWFSAKHVHSVLLNLVSNALKYRHPDRAPVVRVRSHREMGKLVVSVQDNGLGLSGTQQEQLFRVFRRLHPHVEGTGIGLYLVKKILDNAGGAIEVESYLDRGSTFTATFPA
ncbi:ATP-binding protein [uncultured Hymenobacter sp.]|uniref:sensor histidine kinase n=1 Tax=uncultured Hymenobacter sp. TaxID=170016 RepID=UPI0035CC9340